MRVIAGKYKSRRLECPEGSIVRPTTDKVKEAMFGALQFDVVNAYVLDAFAGSGALGIEALSRGAAHVDFVEKNGACLRVLQNNLKTIADSDNYTICKGDVLKNMPLLKKYDILLLDPPYDEGLYDKVLKQAHSEGILKPGCKVVMECRKEFDFFVQMQYNFVKRKNYGDISLWFLMYGELHE